MYYHGTSSLYVPDIEKRGLIPDCQRGAMFALAKEQWDKTGPGHYRPSRGLLEKDPDATTQRFNSVNALWRDMKRGDTATAVYLSTSYGLARYFGKYTAENIGGNPVVFAVDLSRSQVIRDSGVPATGYWHNGPIPPNLLTIVSD